MPERGGDGGRRAAVLLNRGARGAVLPLKFHWDGNEVKRLLCSIAKVSIILVSLPFFAVIPALIGRDSSFLRTRDVYLELGLSGVAKN